MFPANPNVNHKFTLHTTKLFSLECLPIRIFFLFSHNRKTVVDFVNSKENFIYISNLAFLISVLSDSMIFCCGDLLPLLSSATSPDFSQDVIQPCGGMQLETAFSFLNRVMSLVDTVVYTSNFSFGGVEVNRNLSTGGFLRQCTRLGE